MGYAVHLNWDEVSNEGVDEPAAGRTLLGWQRHHSLAGEQDVDVDDNPVLNIECNGGH